MTGGTFTEVDGVNDAYTKLALLAKFSPVTPVRVDPIPVIPSPLGLFTIALLNKPPEKMLTGINI